MLSTFSFVLQMWGRMICRQFKILLNNTNVMQAHTYIRNLHSKPNTLTSPFHLAKFLALSVETYTHTFQCEAQFWFHALKFPFQHWINQTFWSPNINFFSHSWETSASELAVISNLTNPLLRHISKRKHNSPISFWPHLSSKWLSILSVEQRSLQTLLDFVKEK